MIYLSSLKPGWTLPRLIMTSKFLAISFSVRTEERSRGEMRRDPHKSGGRIVVYIRNSFKASIIYNSPATKDANSQQLWRKVQCRKSKYFLLCAAYRPDLVSMSRFLDDFITSFMDSLLLGMEGMVAGDLNADILPGSSCPEGRALMDLCNSLNLRVVTRYILMDLCNSLNLRVVTRYILMDLCNSLNLRVVTRYIFS